MSGFISVAVALYFLGIGIYTVITKRISDRYEIYTKESVDKYAKILGLFYIAAGVIFGVEAVFAFLDQKDANRYFTVKMILIGAAAVVVIVGYALQPKFCVKKTEADKEEDVEENKEEVAEVDVSEEKEDSDEESEESVKED